MWNQSPALIHISFPHDRGFPRVGGDKRDLGQEEVGPHRSSLKLGDYVMPFCEYRPQFFPRSLVPCMYVCTLTHPHLLFSSQCCTGFKLGACLHYARTCSILHMWWAQGPGSHPVASPWVHAAPSDTSSCALSPSYLWSYLPLASRPDVRKEALGAPEKLGL